MLPAQQQNLRARQLRARRLRAQYARH
jgi:hypothetical protein